jgi:hypothetical protein
MIKELICSFCKIQFKWDTNTSRTRKYCCHKCSSEASILTDEQKEKLYIERYEKNVIKNEIDCWGYKRPVMKKGYIEIKAGGKRKLGHRLAWEMVYGKVNPGKFILHHCDNPVCTKISHLYEGTIKQNTNDCINRGRFKYPSRNKRILISKEKSKSYKKSDCIRCKKSFFYDIYSAVGRFCSKNCFFKRNKPLDSQ